MTLLSATVILVARRADRLSRQTVFNYLAVTHLGGVGTWIAILLLAHADAFGGAGCDQLRFGTADRDRPCGSRRDGDEGRRDAAARLAPARASDRAGAGLGADERRDDQGCAVRARARARGVGRRPAGLVRRARARRRRALCRRRRRLRALPARPQAAAGPALDRERRDHRARARRLPDPARPRRRLLGRVRARCRAPAHRQPRRLQVAALPRRGRVRAGGRARSSSTGSEGCCAGCRGRPAPSWSGRWRSPACRR